MNRTFFLTKFNLDHSTIAEKLIKYGANVNAADDVALTPLLVAIINGQ